MRINSSDIQRTHGAEAERPVSKPNSSPANALGSDVAKVSSEHSRVQALAAEISKLPEIRQQKVAELADKIRKGTYEVTPQQTAEALFGALATEPAA